MHGIGCLLHEIVDDLGAKLEEILIVLRKGRKFVRSRVIRSCRQDVIGPAKGMCRMLFKEIRGVDLPEPLQQMTWADAMRRFGSDKPN